MKNRFGIVALTIALVVGTATVAWAGTLTRFIGMNHSGHCARFGIQEAGPHAIAWYGPFKNNVTWDHINSSDKAEQPEYYLEWTVNDCSTNAVLYRDFRILKPSLFQRFDIEPKGQRYILLMR